MKKLCLLFLFIGCLNNICWSQAVFLTFQTQTHIDTIEVSWITQSETNVDYFILQRTFLGNVIFSDIDTINAVGNSTTNQFYSYNDIPPMVDTCYAYRLKVVETNGQFTFSSIVIGCVFIPTSIIQFGNEVKANIYPNPFTNNLTITAKSSESFEVFLYDLTSRQILQQNFITSTTLNTAQLSKGMYLYEVRNKNGVVKKGKVVKE